MSEKPKFIKALIRHLEDAADVILDAPPDPPHDPERVLIVRHMVRLILNLGEDLPLSVWKRAEALLRRVLADAPHDREALLARITVANGMKQPQVALHFARVLADAWPKDETALRRLARAACNAQSLREALEAITACSTTRPGDAGVLIELARALRSEEDLSSAIIALRRLLDTRPDHHAGRKMLVDALLQFGQAEEALTEARRLHSEQPEAADLALLLAIALAETGRASEALEALATAVQSRDLAFGLIGPSCERLATSVGGEAAVSVWRMMAARFPKERLVWMRLSDAVLAHADTESAIQVLREGQTHLAGDHAISLKTARLLVQARRLPEAKAELDTSLALEPGNRVVREVYGKLLLDLGETAQADRVFQDLLISDPDNQTALLGRVDVATGRGDVEAAFQILEDRLLKDD
ncbi:MAG: tetratricopeptide repeat protein [Pseudomonadota bacterium]